MAENLYLSPQHTDSLNINIMDIIDVINEDKEFADSEMSELRSDRNKAGRRSSSSTSLASSIISRTDPEVEQKKKAYVQITEQPQPKALRFRYICEGRSAGSIPGVCSTSENKTYPSIRIVNYKGPAVVVVSCVTVDPPYRPHPHNLVGKEGCSKGVCTVTIDSETMEYSFSNLGIQCVKKKDVDQALKLREEIRVDPFATGFAHRSQPQSIDLNSVRLCFQAFLTNGKGGRFTFPLKAIVSDPIYDKKATSDLNICKLSDCSSSVSGGKEIILLCDKVTKEDIQVKFFEVKDGHVEWEGFGDFQASDVHKQVAICFKTPKYKDLQVDHSVKVFVQLFRPSDKSTSEPRPFEYLPMDADRFYNVNKRRKIFEDSNEQLPPTYIERVYSDHRAMAGEIQSSSPCTRAIRVPSRSTPRLADNVKVEPPDSSEVHASPRGISVKPSVSPQHTAGAGGGGGFIYQNLSPLSPQHNSLQPHQLPPPPLYFPSTSPGHQMMDIPPINSPQNLFYQVPSVIPLDSSCPPYSPENRPPSLDGSSAAYIPNRMEVLTNPPEESKFDLMSPHLTYQPYQNAKPPDAINEILPDLGAINSSDLVFDSVNNLSASLSCSLNLSDVPPMALNPLDRKNTDDEKQRSLSTPVSDNFFANIPPVPPSVSSSVCEVMKSEEGIPSSSSDSVRILRGQLEALNKLSEGR